MSKVEYGFEYVPLLLLEPVVEAYEEEGWDYVDYCSITGLVAYGNYVSEDNYVYQTT